MAEAKVCLVQIHTRGAGRESNRSHLIEKNPFILGRAQDADLPVLMPGASRHHLKIEVISDAIVITDQNSANGTFVNDRLIPKGQAYTLAPGEIVRLGLEEIDFRFLAIPKPIEMLSGAAKTQAMMGSMEEIARQMEAKARAAVEQELKSAKLESERLIAHARMEAEAAKTQGLLELQNQKAELEAENARLSQQVRTTASQERMVAQREADRLLTEAQKQIQRDYDEASRTIEAKLRESQAKCFQMIEDADGKSREILEVAHAEATRVRREATEEARAITSEAMRKSQGSLATLQEEFTREMHDRRAAIKAEETRLKSERAAFETEMGSLQKEAEAARKILGEVEEMEARRQKAKDDYEKFSKQRAEGILKIDLELKEIRERMLVESEARRKQVEQDFAKDKLEAIERVKKEVESREAEYQKSRRMRALELSQRLQEKLVPRLKDWLGRPETAASEMKTSIEIAVNEAHLSDSTFSSIEMAPDQAVAAAPAKMARYRKPAIAVSVAALIGAGVYLEEIKEYLKENGQGSYASERVAQRRADAMYKPTKDKGYRDNYTDNVLYMDGYFETKADPMYIESWTLRLNDLPLLKSLGLQEEDIVRFIAKETNLVQRLGALRESIDAVYLDRGLESMRAAEREDLAEIRQILKSEEAYKKIRELEKKSLEDFKAKKK